MQHTWTIQHIPDQHGRVAVVTGASSGLGFETAKALARRGATVVLAVRDLDRGRAAAGRIARSTVNADVTVQECDLASLDSVRTAAEGIRARHPRIDLLVNNGGVMCTPHGITRDGFETQFGINHLGHFALTGLLLEPLLAVPGSRVVTVTSLAHRFTRINLNDLQWKHRRYNRFAAYGQSKLANLMFTYELQRRLAERNTDTLAIAAHPGSAQTAIMRHLPGPLPRVAKAFGPLLAQPPARGALPMLRAATDPTAHGGQFYGPDGFQQTMGTPVVVTSAGQSHDTAVQHRLWTMSESLTRVAYGI
ncbi:oxidoreductase [Streptomyces sp. TBY4]|uniref:oxidoreductase n=1 Tax=Streptomyces sp. TBY4 TaxID=2962030 RepID=UPI0020B815C1|nr:oxidoreductase [Streptomyces sp. TBY4]MCP3753693.1 oxidoreductase [Streptomyces sp. TBY4]